MQMLCSGSVMGLALLGQWLDSLIPRPPNPEDSMTHWYKQKQSESHTSSNSSPNPTGLEMAVEISSASSCCSAMSCINSSTLSMSLEKKGKIQYQQAPSQSTLHFLGSVEVPHHSDTSKIHFACKSGFYPPGLNTIIDVFSVFPCKLSSQQLYRH